MHHEFYHLAKKLVRNYQPGQFAMATVVRVQGSAYRREGTRMVIGKNGNWFGNISGGCLEGDIRNKAIEAIKQSECTLVSYDTRESKNKEIRVALGCSGIIDILIEPVENDLLRLSENLIQFFEKEETAFLQTEIQLIKSKVRVSRRLSQKQPNDFPQSAFENENFCRIEKSEFKIMVDEFIGLQRKIVIWGSGPDVIPLATFAQQLGWRIEITSDCGLENLRQQLPGLTIHQTNFDDFKEKVNLHENTAVLLVSHDFYKDYFMLEKIADKATSYIGIMGPKRRGARILEELIKRNPRLEFDKNKLHYPIGLDIGSDNPSEIALSIIAEIQAHFSGKDAAPLREKESRIHDSFNRSLSEEYNPDNNTCFINNLQ